MTGVQIRQAVADDASRCGHIFFDAFEAIAIGRGFPIDPASRDSANFQMNSMLATEGGLVALRDGALIGSAC